MIAGLFLAVLAGYGARLFVIRYSLCRSCSVSSSWWKARRSPWKSTAPGRRTRPCRPRAFILPPLDPPALAKADRRCMRRIAALPPGAIITEFPFGDTAWEIRYVYYAAAHWKPITNGYSGAFPQRYKERAARLQRVPPTPTPPGRPCETPGQRTSSSTATLSRSRKTPRVSRHG